MEPYTDGDCVDVIENEGIGYAVLDKCDSRHIASPETGKLWDAAAEALNALVAHLEKQTGREVDG